MKSAGFARKPKHEGAHGHNLTSLVDCFAIILVYLLLATTFGDLSVDIEKDIQLPKATEAKALVSDYMVVVKDGLSNNPTYMVDKQEVRLDNLAAVLKAKADSMPAEEGKSKSIVIQADKKMSYAKLNPLIMVSLLAGFQEIQFAVLKDEAK